MYRDTDLQELFDRIPTGSDHPLKVPNWDTPFRTKVAKANQEGDCIINIRGGYYRPIPGVDDEAVEQYFARELSRAREILLKRKRMKEAYEQRRIQACLAKAGVR